MWRKETRINHVIKQIKRNRNLDKQQQPIRFKSRRSFFISNERYDTDAIWFVAGSMLWHVIFYFWYIDIEWEPGDEWIEFKTQCYELNWNEIEKSRRSNQTYTMCIHLEQVFRAIEMSSIVDMRSYSLHPMMRTHELQFIYIHTAHLYKAKRMKRWRIANCKKNGNDAREWKTLNRESKKICFPLNFMWLRSSKIWCQWVRTGCTILRVAWH